MAQFHCLTFLTDYGPGEAFVAVCHAAASQIGSDVQITDITHLVSPGDIGGAAARRFGYGREPKWRSS
jgi:S-adenosylmethionine hydrolase